MFATSLTPVSPVRPVAPWIGGKRNLARKLCAMIEATPHDLYAEPFVGMGGVFFRRRSRPKCEIINDWSGEVANLFRCMRAHPAALTELTAWMLASREEFFRQRDIDPTPLTDLQRAARFIYLQKNSFGGLVSKRQFGVNSTGASRFRPSDVGADLLTAGKRLERVTIENLDWSVFIDRYDRAGALFYLDPPYFGCERDYGDGFGREQFARMAEQLGRLKGRFILSLNDRPQVRELFASFDIEEVEVSYSRQVDKAREVIITGGG